MFTKKDTSSLLKYIYCTKKNKEPGMLESTAASVVLMVCTQANLGPQSLYHSIEIPEKRSLSTATGLVGKGDA